MRVLVAEDDALYRAMFQRLLSPEYEPTFAEDGNAAWKLLQLEDAPQLVILDWLMPGMNGVDVCRKLRAIPEKEALYILMATAKQDIDDVLMAFDAGANDYITKPFNALELKARLNAAAASSSCRPCSPSACRNCRRRFPGSNCCRACYPSAPIASASATIAITGNNWRPIWGITPKLPSLMGFVRSAMKRLQNLSLKDWRTPHR